MIRGFRDKRTEAVFNRKRVPSLSLEIQKASQRKLVMLNAAVRLEDLRVPPGNRLEPLEGKRKGQHSIRVNDQWRICFRWRHGDAHDVELADYH